MEPEVSVSCLFVLVFFPSRGYEAKQWVGCVKRNQSCRFGFGSQGWLLKQTNQE